VTRLLAALVSFMVDDQLNSLAAGKDDLSSKVMQLLLSRLYTVQVAKA